MADNHGILLETGTNEIEIMEFTIGESVFGINVAKVKEILMQEPVIKMTHSHPSVEGVFKPRDIIITIIDLPNYLGIDVEHDPDRDLFIVTNFNQLHVGFRVHKVLGIHRRTWQDIQKPDKTVYGGDDGVATGIAEINDRIVTILDFEKIVAEISPQTSIQSSDITEIVDQQVNRPIVIAEDSPLLMKMILEALNKAGFTNITNFSNGQEAWDYIKSLDRSTILEQISCVMTDIEMPSMDGHRLTKLIKSDPQLSKIPVIIFSSLINQEMRVKGEEIGADDQISKPEIGRLIKTLSSLISDSRKNLDKE